MNEYYEQGFIDKCAQHNINPQRLVKWAQATKLIPGEKGEGATEKDTDNVTKMTRNFTRQQKIKELRTAQADAKAKSNYADSLKPGNIIQRNFPAATTAVNKVNARGK